MLTCRLPLAACCLLLACCLLFAIAAAAAAAAAVVAAAAAAADKNCVDSFFVAIVWRRFRRSCPQAGTWRSTLHQGELIIGGRIINCRQADAHGTPKSALQQSLLLAQRQQLWLEFIVSQFFQ